MTSRWPWYVALLSLQLVQAELVKQMGVWVSELQAEGLCRGGWVGLAVALVGRQV